MYNDILETIDAVIERYQKTELTEFFTEIARDSLIAGLNISKQLVNSIGEINTQEIAYEKFEELANTYREILPSDEFEEILSEQLKKVADE